MNTENELLQRSVTLRGTPSYETRMRSVPRDRTAPEGYVPDPLLGGPDLVEERPFTVEELSLRYDPDRNGGEHPLFTVAQWQTEVAAETTRMGYWFWVVKEINDAVTGGMDVEFARGLD